MKASFITFEGGEGSGKSTQSEIIINYLNEHGHKCVKTREPGGTNVSEKIRNLVLDAKNDNICLETEILLFAASRIQLVNEFIIPNIQAGNTVICDRFIDSNFVYQGLTTGDNLEKVKMANSFATQKIMPDLTFYFNISPEDAFARKNGADENDRMEMKGMEFHRKVRAGFLEIAKMYPERIVVIDANKSIEEVTEQIINVLRKRGIID